MWNCRVSEQISQCCCCCLIDRQVQVQVDGFHRIIVHEAESAITHRLRHQAVINARVLMTFAAPLPPLPKLVNPAAMTTHLHLPPHRMTDVATPTSRNVTAATVSVPVPVQAAAWITTSVKEEGTERGTVIVTVTATELVTANTSVAAHAVENDTAWLSASPSDICMYMFTIIGTLFIVCFHFHLMCCFVEAARRDVG